MPSWDTLLTAPWRAYPAAFLVVAGILVAACGIRRERHELRRPPTDPGLGWALARTLRSTIAGAALAGVGLGWYYASAATIIVSALVWLEEMLEISSVLRARRTGERSSLSQRRSPGPGHGTESGER